MRNRPWGGPGSIVTDAGANLVDAEIYLFIFVALVGPIVLWIWSVQYRSSNMIGYVGSHLVLDSIVAHAQTSFRWVTWSHLQSFPRSHRG